MVLLIVNRFAARGATYGQARFSVTTPITTLARNPAETGRLAKAISSRTAAPKLANSHCVNPPAPA